MTRPWRTVKIQAESDTVNADVTAEFDAVIFRP